jgi:hypothetical protein
MDELTLDHELTLFRDFRGDTPGPSAAETEAARARLLEAIAVQCTAAARPAPSRRGWGWARLFARKRFWAPIAAAVAVAAVAITMVLLAVPGPAAQKTKPSVHPHHHTSHRAHGTSRLAGGHGPGSRAAGQNAAARGGAAGSASPGKAGTPGSAGSGGPGGSGPATPTATALTVSPEAAFSAHQVTMTATVTDQAGGNLTGGGVTFALYLNETISPASAVNVCLDAPVTDNVATCTYTPTSAEAGPYLVRAGYTGYRQYESSASAAASLTVTAIATGTALTSVSPAEASPGQTVTLTATVTDQAGDNLTGGTVTFFWSPAPVNGVAPASSLDMCLHSPLTYDPAANDNVATCHYTIPSGMTAGTLDMQAEYADPSGPYPESASGIVAFTVEG